MLATKTLKGYPRSVQKIGFLGDGRLFIDSHTFDDDHGDSASTDYLIRPPGLAPEGDALRYQGADRR